MYPTRLVNILFLLLLNFSLFAQKDDIPKKYKRIIKLNLTGVFEKTYYEQTNNKNNRLNIRQNTITEFSTNITPSFSYFTKRKDIVEFEVLARFFPYKRIKLDSSSKFFVNERFGKDLNTYTQSTLTEELKNRDFYLSTRVSYNFNLTKKTSKTIVTIGPLAQLYYIFSQTQLYTIVLPNQKVTTNRIGVDFEIIAKIGRNVGKRTYFEFSLPVKLMNVNYHSGLKNNNLGIKPIQVVNTLKNHFIDNSYYRQFTPQLSLGYRF